MPINSSVLALDVGDKRIGVAIASLVARLPRPLTTLQTSNYLQPLQQLINDEQVVTLVVGLPRNQEGRPTEQTQKVQAFASELKKLGLPVDMQDESITSRQAEAELQARGRAYVKEDIDALAATYILEDWLNEHKDNHDRSD